MVLEARELGLPVGTEFGAHATLDEGPAHGRRLALQLGELSRVFGRQHIRDGGHELRHLHDRTFEAAECSREFHGIAPAVERDAEEACAGKARSNAPDIGADARIARGAGGEAVLFAIVHGAATLASVTVQDAMRRMANQDYLAAQRDGIVADARDTLVELGGGVGPARDTVSYNRPPGHVLRSGPECCVCTGGTVDATISANAA